jgi:hypothetical protein
MEDVKTWLSSQAANVFDTGMQKRTSQCDKCLNFGGDYVENYLKYVCIFLYIINLFSFLFC